MIVYINMRDKTPEERIHYLVRASIYFNYYGENVFNALSANHIFTTDWKYLKIFDNRCCDVTNHSGEIDVIHIISIDGIDDFNKNHCNGFERQFRTSKRFKEFCNKNNYRDICDDNFDVDKIGVNFISFGVEDKTKISFITKNRYKVFGNDFFDDNTRNRLGTMSKPGKFYKKIYPDASTEECDIFTRAVRTYNGEASGDNFETMDNVWSAYNEDEYADPDDGTLGESCMKHSECEDYFDIYENNGVKVLTLVNEDKKVTARALLWKNVEFNDKTNGKVFNQNLMDRVYTNDSRDEDRFFDWAVKNNYIRKKEQNFSNKEGMVYPNKNCFEAIVKFSGDSNFKAVSYPYCDTMTYIGYDYDYLSNEEGDEHHILECTEGGIATKHLVWSEYEQRRINEDCVVESSFVCGYIHEDNAMVINEHGYHSYDWIPRDFDIEIIEVGCRKYTKCFDQLKYSKYHDEYFVMTRTHNYIWCPIDEDWIAENFTVEIDSIRYNKFGKNVTSLGSKGYIRSCVISNATPQLELEV